METGLYALGILSFAYYMAILWYTKRKNSTFSWFWVAYGVLNIILGMIVSKASDWVDYAIIGIGTVFGLIFIGCAILILCAFVSLVPGKLDCIIVLGAQLRGDTVSESLRRRLDRALRYLRENPGTFCIVTGGQGKGETTTEANAMAEYMTLHGIEKDRICLEKESKSTYENLENAKMFLEDGEKVGIVTNNFHIYRSLKIAKKLGYRKVYGIPTGCDPILFLNYLVREFFALIVMTVKYREKESD